MSACICWQYNCIMVICFAEQLQSSSQKGEGYIYYDPGVPFLGTCLGNSWMYAQEGVGSSTIWFVVIKPQELPECECCVRPQGGALQRCHRFPEHIVDCKSKLQVVYVYTSGNNNYHGLFIAPITGKDIRVMVSQRVLALVFSLIFLLTFLRERMPIFCIHKND